MFRPVLSLVQDARPGGGIRHPVIYRRLSGFKYESRFPFLIRWNPANSVVPGRKSHPMLCVTIALRWFRWISMCGGRFTGFNTVYHHVFPPGGCNKSLGMPGGARRYPQRILWEAVSEPQRAENSSPQIKLPFR